MAPGSRRRVRCPVCGSARLNPWVELRDRAVLTCADCGVRCTDRYGEEAEVRAYYGRVLAHHGKAEGLETQEGALQAIASEQADSMERVLGPRRQGRFLEIGCARGHLLSELAARGWAVSGVEIGDRAAREAGARRHGHVHEGTVEDAPFPPGSFDRIGMFDVLAHLIDPVRTLKAIRPLLAPGGHLVLSTVDEDWPLVPAFQRAFRLLPRQTSVLRDEMYEGQHYCYFGRRSIGPLLRLAGLELHHVEALQPLSARYFVHQYGWQRRMGLLAMSRLDAFLGSARKMLVVARADGSS